MNKMLSRLMENINVTINFSYLTESFIIEFSLIILYYSISYTQALFPFKKFSVDLFHDKQNHGWKFRHFLFAITSL